MVNLVTGIYTWLPRPGALIRAGGVLYRVDDSPVTLMAGPVPAWRPFGTGMTDGPDVRQLQADLIAGHFAGGLFTTPTGHYDLATADAVERWQAARGLTVTGMIPLGQVVFLPTAVLVGAMNVAAGEAAAAGQRPYQVTTGQRTVTVPLNPNLPPTSRRRERLDRPAVPGQRARDDHRAAAVRRQLTGDAPRAPPAPG